jgi:hypothetical protein
VNEFVASTLFVIHLNVRAFEAPCSLEKELAVKDGSCSLTHIPYFFFRNWRLKEALSGVTWFRPCFLRQDAMRHPPSFVSVILKSTRRSGKTL